MEGEKNIEQDNTDKFSDFEISQAGVSDYRAHISPEFARESIEQALPDFRVDSIEMFTEHSIGSVTFLVNGEYIFRFPRHEKAEKSLEMELRVVPELHDKVSVPIPDFEFSGSQSGKPFHFVGYKKLEGKELTSEILNDADGNPDPKIVKEIATFFSEMHGLDIEKARRSGLEERNEEQFFHTQLKEARQHVFPALREQFPKEMESIIKKIEETFEDYFSDKKNFEYIPKVLHGDLEAEHILIDPRTHVVTGILDFGSVHIGDPDYDLWRPYSHFGKKFIDALLEYYPHADSKQLFQKMEFFWTAQVIHRVLRVILVDDKEEISYGLDRVKERLLDKKQKTGSA